MFPEDFTQKRKGAKNAEFLYVKFSFYYDIFSFNEDHEIIKVIFQTTTLRPLRLCASA